VLHTEPVLLLTALRAGLLCLVSFGFELKPEQIGTVMLFAEAVFAILTRGQVRPVDRDGKLRTPPDTRGAA
jgi:hypothetical protein